MLVERLRRRRAEASIERNCFCLRTTVPFKQLGAYVAHHQDLADGHWPEVEAGLIEHGVKSLRIWAPSDRDPSKADSNMLTMAIEMTPGTTLGALGPGSSYRTGHPRVGQWESMMDSIHGAVYLCWKRTVSNH